jgi:sec-independent protein translocase protein TatA
MPFRMGPIELAIILVIVLVLFGVGRIGRIGGELGKGIRAFRLGIKDEEEDGISDNDSTIESENSDAGDL